MPLADVAGAAELGVRTVIRRPQAEILAPLMSGLSQKCFELNVIELETNRWLTRFEVGNFSKSQVIDARLRSAAFDLAASGDSLRGTQVIPARMLRTFAILMCWVIWYQIQGWPPTSRPDLGLALFAGVTIFGFLSGKLVRKVIFALPVLPAKSNNGGENWDEVTSRFDIDISNTVQKPAPSVINRTMRKQI